MPRPVAGTVLPDVTLPDTTGAVRRLADLPGGDPLVLHTYRGWFCPKERAYFRQVLLPLQELAEVGYVRIVSVSVEPPEVSAAFRAGLDARWTFLSDVDRVWQSTLDLREVTDTVHDPYLPTVLICAPDLTVRRVYDGYWMWGRPSLADLWADLRDVAPGVDGAAWLTSPGWRCSTPRRRERWRWPIHATEPWPATSSSRSAARSRTAPHRTAPHRTAVRVEPSLVGDGPALAVSLVLPPRGARPLFDDPAVVGAMRAVLRDPGRTTLLSTLVDGPTKWAGSISGADPRRVADRPARWAEDPFARLGPQHRLLVPADVLCPRPLPPGPGHQRHAGAPWPWGRFPAA